MNLWTHTLCCVSEHPNDDLLTLKLTTFADADNGDKQTKSGWMTTVCACFTYVRQIQPV